MTTGVWEDVWDLTSLALGQNSLYSRNVGYPVASLQVDNLSGFWLFIPDANTWVPPNWFGLMVTLPQNSGYLTIQAGNNPVGYTPPLVVSGGLVYIHAYQDVQPYNQGASQAVGGVNTTQIGAIVGLQSFGPLATGSLHPLSQDFHGRLDVAAGETQNWLDADSLGSQGLAIPQQSAQIPVNPTAVALFAFNDTTGLWERFRRDGWRKPYDVQGNSQAAANVQASVVLPAVAGQRYVLDYADFYAFTTASVAFSNNIDILDGASIIWSDVIVFPAAVTSKSIEVGPEMGLHGTPGNSMTLRFRAAGGVTTVEGLNYGAYLLPANL